MFLYPSSGLLVVSAKFAKMITKRHYIYFKFFLFRYTERERERTQRLVGRWIKYGRSWVGKEEQNNKTYYMKIFN